MRSASERWKKGDELVCPQLFGLTAALPEVCQLFLLLGDLNTFLLFFLLIFSVFLLTTNSALHLLLTAELLWITLYALTLLAGLIYDNLNLLSLTFFFLIFSAVEFGVGLILLLLQHLLTRSLNLYEGDKNVFKFSNRLVRALNLNRLGLKL